MKWLLLALLAIAIVIALALLVWWLIKKPEKSTLRSHQVAVGGSSVWCFQGGAWSLMEDNSARGFIAGPPPAEPGICEGYCVKVASVPAPRAQ